VKSQYALRKLIGGLPLIIGVTLVSFALMVYFGPTDLPAAGKNLRRAGLEVRQQLGYDQPFLQRYSASCGRCHADFGNASTGEPVIELLAKTIPFR
jgi:peptide/nickel transport system permease protein